MDRLAALRAWWTHRNSTQKWTLVWMLAVTLVVGYTFDRILTEADHQAAEQKRATIAFCTQMRVQATLPIPPTATDFARNSVRGAAFAYQIAGCQRFVPALRPEDIDPDAFRPAPSPSR